eukprot:NODE_234_length_2872_cov_57.047654_g218_i0.p1 GENE.NODE_234_length_2872_cov_57.047654_g218_i0~~NODE_234_length_2872_cov_57.047654_g218_i0.p1  ORF type:complete len:678 (-),score=119.04 NODE_234_length_2872_cov_57.047654_g218_i0:211-2244(-)
MEDGSGALQFQICNEDRDCVYFGNLPVSNLQIGVQKTESLTFKDAPPGSNLSVRVRRVADPANTTPTSTPATPSGAATRRPPPRNQGLDSSDEEEAPVPTNRGGGGLDTPESDEPPPVTRTAPRGGLDSDSDGTPPPPAQQAMHARATAAGGLDTPESDAPAVAGPTRGGLDSDSDDAPPPRPPPHRVAAPIGPPATIAPPKPKKPVSEENQVRIFGTNLGTHPTERDNTYRLRQLLNIKGIEFQDIDCAEQRFREVWNLAKKVSEQTEMPQLFVGTRFVGLYDQVDEWNDCGELELRIEPPRRITKLTMEPYPIVLGAGGDMLEGVRIRMDKPAYLGGLSFEIRGFLGVIATPSVVVLQKDQCLSEEFTLQASAPPAVQIGANNVEIVVTQSSWNHNTIRDTFQVPMSVYRVAINDVRLSAPVCVIPGGAQSPSVAFDVDQPAVQGAVKLTPRAPGIVFVLASVRIKPGNRQSNTFVIQATPGACRGPVTITVEAVGEVCNENDLQPCYSVTGLSIGDIPYHKPMPPARAPPLNNEEPTQAAAVPDIPSPPQDSSGRHHLMGMRIRDGSELPNVLVTDIHRGGVADKAGVRVGDIILKVSGERVASCDHFWDCVAQCASSNAYAGVVVLELYRMNQRFRVDCALPICSLPPRVAQPLRSDMEEIIYRKMLRKSQWF